MKGRVPLTGALSYFTSFASRSLYSNDVGQLASCCSFKYVPTARRNKGHCMAYRVERK
jgi:hypothetical protein